MAYIEFNDVVKEYPAGSSSIRALDGASFAADEGELSVILGQSGAGKTTALNILGGMDTATSGRVIVGGRDITDLNHHDLVTYRRNDIGFVFQFYNLIPNLTALENVELASQICTDHFDPAQTLAKVGLADRLGNFPAQLSGGEPQRAAPALDYETGKEVLQLLQDICRTERMTVLIVTHNSALAPMAHKVIRFRSGKVTSQETNEHPVPISQIEW